MRSNLKIKDLKKGDYVLCISGVPSYDLTERKIYTVKEVGVPNNELIKINSIDGGWLPDRFIKV